MAQIAAYQIICAGQLSAFQEHVVSWIRANQKVWLGHNHPSHTLNPFHDLLLHTFTQAKFRPRENFGILLQDWWRNIEPEFFIQSESNNLRFQTAAGQDGGDNHVGV